MGSMICGIQQRKKICCFSNYMGPKAFFFNKSQILIRIFFFMLFLLIPVMLTCTGSEPHCISEVLDLGKSVPEVPFQIALIW